MDWEEYSRRRLRADERAAIMHLDMLARSFEYVAEKLSGRLQGYRTLKRDLGFIRWACKRITEKALEGAGEEMAEHLLRQSRDWRLGLERVSVQGRKDEVVMPMEHEWQLIHICLESRCSLCMLTDGECKTCPIRKMLRIYCDEPEPGSLHGCGFQGSDLNDNVKNMNKPERL